MSELRGPMPLKDLPGYLDSVRERGQGDFVPVVEMGRIVDDRPSGWGRALAYSSVACLFVAIGAVGVALTSTGSIVIDAGGLDSEAVAAMVSDEGGRVISVKENEDGTKEVRVLTFKRMSSFLDQLRSNKDFKRVEAK